jgi:hypothetical protein
MSRFAIEPIIEPPCPPGRPRGCTCYFDFVWLAITEVKPEGMSGWVFTMWDWSEAKGWAQWFTHRHEHFATGWSTIRNRARHLMLEGHRPDIEAISPELARLAGWYRQYGWHPMSKDNDTHDHYGLLQH